MRNARVLSASCAVHTAQRLEERAQVEANRRMILQCLDAAAAYRPDIVCFPEVELQRGLSRYRCRHSERREESFEAESA